MHDYGCPYCKNTHDAASRSGDVPQGHLSSFRGAGFYCAGYLRSIKHHERRILMVAQLGPETVNLRSRPEL